EVLQPFPSKTLEQLGALALRDATFGHQREITEVQLDRFAPTGDPAARDYLHGQARVGASRLAPECHGKDAHDDGGVPCYSPWSCTCGPSRCDARCLARSGISDKARHTRSREFIGESFRKFMNKRVVLTTVGRSIRQRVDNKWRQRPLR